MFEDKLFGMPMFRKKMFSQVPFGESGMLRFESTNSTITPAITLSGGPTPLWQAQEAGGGTFIYEAASFSHTKTAGTGNLTVRLINTESVKNFVTVIDFNGDGIVSSFFDLNITKFVNLTSLRLYNNQFYGDLSNYSFPILLNLLYLYNNNLSGDFSVTNWDIVDVVDVGNNSFTGDLSTKNISSTMTAFYAYGNSFTKGPRIPVGSVSISVYYINNNGLSQSAVDQICLDSYNNRTNFTNSTPTFNVGGTNAAPSGIYQDATPPTTGKEYIYKLVNDPDLEGFNKQVWTYTA